MAAPEATAAGSSVLVGFDPMASVTADPLRCAACACNGRGGSVPASMAACTPHLSMHVCHAAELPALRGAWSGRGPSPSQVRAAT